eukprot:symbB.v1.2.016289.t1/scaffold1236.1/size130149/7
MCFNVSLSETAGSSLPYSPACPAKLVFAMADAMGASSRKPTGMKGKVHDLATTLQTQNEELSIEKGHVHSIKADNANSSTGMQGQLNDIKRYFAADVQRMMEEFDVQAQLQSSENVRLQQQVTCLKGEKTSIHQQVIALQRRIEARTWGFPGENMCIDPKKPRRSKRRLDMSELGSKRSRRPVAFKQIFTLRWVVCPALLFALVCFADLAAIVAPLDVTKHMSSYEGSTSSPLPKDGAEGPNGPRSNCRSATAEMLVISMQAVLRASLLVTFRLAQRQRSAKVLP